jgi:hypothetical protein
MEVRKRPRGQEGKHIPPSHDRKRMEVSKGPRGQERKHIPPSDDAKRMEVTKGQGDKRDGTYLLVTTERGWR